MLFDQRVIFSDNGTLTDISTLVDDFRNGSYTLPYVSGSSQYIYIGTFLPFNHRYIDIGTANTQDSEVEIEIWNGSSFDSAIDVLDQTRVGAVSLAQDGYLRWSCDRNKVWVRESDSFSVTGISDSNIPNFYWMRLSWTASLFATTTLRFIGNKFSNDQLLYSYYPDFNNTNLLLAFAAGKTDWEEQHYVAAEQIIRELRRRNYILSGDQILDYELFSEPSVHKVAELIYTGLGQTFEDKRKAAEAKYIATLDLGHLNVDLNQDGNLDTYERVTQTGFMTR